MVVGSAFLILGIVQWANAHQRQDRELAERQYRLASQNDRLDSFVSVVSHDLRNPLNEAQGRLEVAREQHDDENLDDVARARDRMAKLIDDLLKLAREGEDVGETERIALADLSNRWWNNVETDVAVIEIDTDQVILTDRSCLQQLLENLFQNSVEHSGSNITITIGDLEDGFYIEDDVPGIPPEDCDQVFDAGFTTEEGGTGFGLPIVKEIAEAHGWNIHVTEGVEGGARFETTGVETV